MSKFTLTPNQEAAVSRMVNEPSRAALNGSSLGVGKSAMGVEVIKRLNLGVNVVTGPLHTLDGWERHFDLLAAGELIHANNKNKAGKLALSDLKFGVPGNYFLGREYARLLDWKSIQVGAWVADESHSMVNGKSKGFERHRQEVMPTEYRLHQSATWFGAKFENARTVAQLLWPELDGFEQPADRSMTRWRDYWCAKGVTDFWTADLSIVARATRMNPDLIIDTRLNRDGKEVAWLIRVEHVTGEASPGKFASELPCYVQMQSDLPELEPIPIYYDLSATQRRMYREMEEQSLAWLKDNPLVAELPITKRIRLREITLAEPSLSGNDEIFFAPDAKSALFDVSRELESDLLGEQILMGTHSAKFARYYAERMGSRAYAWTGDASEQSRADAKADFIKGSVQHLVATQAAIGEGVDGLQGASHVMFELSLNDNQIMNQQFRGRLNRRGQVKPVVCYRFVARDTLDDPQHESLLKRELGMRQSMSVPA